MRRRRRIPKPSFVSASGYSTVSQLNQPTKKIVGTLPVTLFGRVMKVRKRSPRLFVDGHIRITGMASPSWCPLPTQVKGYRFRGASSGRTRDDRSDSLRCHQEHRLEGEAGPLHRDHPTLAFEGRSRPHEVIAR